MLTGHAAPAWRVADERDAEQLGLPLRYYAVSPDGPLADHTGTWLGLYGIAPDGAVLVRPDAHVAWRSPTVDASPATRLADTVRRILSL